VRFGCGPASPCPFSSPTTVHPDLRGEGVSMHARIERYGERMTHVDTAAPCCDSDDGLRVVASNTTLFS